MSQIEYYREQAERAQTMAEKTTLPNVRARYLESAETWLRFVARAQRLQSSETSSSEGLKRAPRFL